MLCPKCGNAMNKRENNNQPYWDLELVKWEKINKDVLILLAEYALNFQNLMNAVAPASELCLERKKLYNALRMKGVKIDNILGMIRYLLCPNYGEKIILNKQIIDKKKYFHTLCNELNLQNYIKNSVSGGLGPEDQYFLDRENIMIQI